MSAIANEASMVSAMHHLSLSAPISVPPMTANGSMTQHQVDNYTIFMLGGIEWNLNQLPNGAQLGGRQMMPDGTTREVMAVIIPREDRAEFEMFQFPVWKALRMKPSAYIVSAAGKVVCPRSEAIFVVLNSYGPDLHSVLKRLGRFDEKDALIYFRHLLAAVQHCHENSIALNDLKLSHVNLITSSRGTYAMIGNLGQARLGPIDTPSSADLSAPAYMNPQGRASTGRHADLWCLSVILYCMVVGRYPFQDTKDGTTVFDLRLPHGLSDKMKEFFIYAFQSNPDQRLSLEKMISYC